MTAILRIVMYLVLITIFFSQFDLLEEAEEGQFVEEHFTHIHQQVLSTLLQPAREERGEGDNRFISCSASVDRERIKLCSQHRWIQKKTFED